MNLLKVAALWVFFTFRQFWLWALTFGAWGRMGNYVLDDRERLDGVEYRLDELMRHLEHSGITTIPGHIEPPRATTFGEGMTVEQERQMIADSALEQAREASYVKCLHCRGFGREPVSGYAFGAVLPSDLVKACAICGGTGKVSPPRETNEGPEAGATEVPRSGGDSGAP